MNNQLLLLIAFLQAVAVVQCAVALRQNKRQRAIGNAWMDYVVYKELYLNITHEPAARRLNKVRMALDNGA